MSLNKVMLICRLGTDPEKRVTKGGSSVVSFSAATTEKYKDQQGNKQERAEWHRVVLWNRLADLAEQYLSKGKQVYVEGSLRTNEWTDKDGNKRYTTEVIGQTLQFLESGSSDRQSNNNNQNQSNKPQNNYSRPNVNNYKQNLGQMSDQAPHPDDDFLDELEIPF